VKRTKAVFDASVIVRAVLYRADEARTWLHSVGSGRAEVVIAPDLIYAEVANAFAQHVRRGRLAVEDAVEALAGVVDLPLDVRPNRGVCEFAFAAAAQLDLTAYDAHYLALAEAEEAVLVTADRRLAEVASRSVLLD